MKVLDRFLNYVSYETTALEEKDDGPSNPKILSLSNEMLRELQALHPYEISINKFGAVDAKFAGTGKKAQIAFLSHLDTSNQASGYQVKPQIIENYQGQDIKLNEELTLTEKEFPSLSYSHGHTIVTTSGDTLLGGDDKAGVAIIMTALSELMENKEERRPLEIIFTTDEEIGADAEHVSMEQVTSKYGYTIDGGDERAVSIETFTAYAMEAKFKGKSIHPGSAKDKMVNASNVLIHFQEALPEVLRPEETEGKEPFFHLCSIKGTEDSAEAEYIIRSFDEDQIAQMIDLAKLTAKRINDHIGYEALTLSFQLQYHNMKVVLDKYPEIKEEIEKAYKKENLPFVYFPVRGGTTGSQLSFKGLPCPNLGTGGYNMHGRYEYVDVNQMEDMVRIVKDLMRA